MGHKTPPQDPPLLSCHLLILLLVWLPLALCQSEAHSVNTAVMSSTTDNAMARFLFAILQQKCLKDVSVSRMGPLGFNSPEADPVQIDWTKVAENPILIQKITNGHAARMRYSRFRASVLGIEPQRRNRNPNNKSKVTKSKKAPKGKKEKDEAVKPDPNAATDARADDGNISLKNESLVKTEAQQSRIDVGLAPTDRPPASAAEAQLHFHNRLMTPCSETDLFGPAASYCKSPGSDMLHHDQPFDYNSAAAAAHCVVHDQGSWQPSPSYSPFPISAYDLESYSTPAAFCDHQHTPHPEGFGIAPSAMMPPDHSHTPVKHEDWDARLS